MKMKYGFLVFVVGFTLALAGCGSGGGGGSTSNNPPAVTTVSGTAATGAALANMTVILKDKNGTTKQSATDPNGKYSIDAAGLTAPFLLKVTDGTNSLYSIATATGTANIHQFTDLIIKNWYKVQGTTVDTVFGSAGAISVPTATEVNTIEAVIRQIISSWLTGAGLNPDKFNLINSSFDANSSGFDKVLDVVKISVASGTVTIAPVDNSSGVPVQGDPIATLSENTDLSQGTNPLQAAITGVNQTLSNWASIVTTKGTNLTGSDIVGLYDSNYSDIGVAGATAAANQDVSIKGFTLTSLSVKDIVSYDGANSVIVVTCMATYTQDGVTYNNQDVWEGGRLFKKGVDDVWRFSGNRRIRIRAGIKKWMASTGTTVKPILDINLDAPTGTVSQVQVSGPSLTSNPTTLSKSTGNPDETFYISDNGPVNTAPAIGSLYTFTITKSDSSSITYKAALKGTTTETFNITTPTGYTLTDAKLGSQLSASWTLPTTFNITGVFLGGWVWGSGGSCSGIKGTVSSSNTSGIITLPVTCNGQSVTGAGISIHISGNNGVRSIASYTFQ